MSGVLHGVVASLKAAAAAATDSFFKYVTLLLHGDGTNGAQNNTFLDGSTNAFTITRNGNTTQGSFSPFSQTGWSNYFDTSGDSLSVPYSSTLALGTGDCTIEAWVYLASYPQQFNNVVDVRESTISYANNAISFGLENNGALNFYAGSYSSGSAVVSTAAGEVALNSWFHIAMARSSGTTKLYVNGVEKASSANSWNQTSGTATALYIGNALVARQVNGYISNLRIVKGTAVYTSAFTPPTSPLTAITNTSLLTCQSNRFIDNSSNGFTITRNGDVRVEAFSPFNPTAAWSAGTNGGSGYFDGNGDYLASPANTALALGTGDFTVECWVYATATPSDVGIYEGRSNGNAGTVDGFTLTAFSGSVIRIYSNAILIASTGTVYVNTWCHVAVVRASGTWTLYINGVSQGTSTTSRDLTNNDALVGAGRYGVSGAATAYFPGYISNFRVVKGTAVYTANFTPPTSPLTAITNTSLLLNFTNGGIFDNASQTVLETVGNAQVSTTQKKYGTGSMYFDGTGDYLTAPDRPALRFGTGNFTVEFWWYPASIAGFQTLFDKGYTAAGGLLLQTGNGNGTIVVYAAGVAVITASSGSSINTWDHYALVRSGTTLTLYRNGTSVGSATNSTNYNSTAALFLGGSLGGGGYYVNGYIDDLRITNGYARYTANFTPPSAAFPDN